MAKLCKERYEKITKHDDNEEEEEEEEDQDGLDIDEYASKSADSLKLTRPPKFNVEKNNRTVFVGNLPKTMNTRTIKRLFRDCGDIESVRIRCVAPEKEKLSKRVAAITKQMHDKVDSFNAYVVFKTNPEDKTLKNALTKNGQLIDGHHIRVDRASKPKSQKHKVKVSRKKSVFIGNLPFDVKDDEVYTFFENLGPIDNVRIVRDQITSIGKGFGFVCFKDRATVIKALQLNGRQFKNRSLRITKVVDETILSSGAQGAPPKKNKRKRKSSVGLKGLLEQKQKLRHKGKGKPKSVRSMG